MTATFTHFRVLSILIITFFTLTAQAQNNCDTCTAPWGPPQQLVLNGQTVTGKPSSCTYTFVYEYRERNCNGNIEIELTNLYINQETTGTFCTLNNYMDCYNSRQSGVRSLVEHLGIPMTFSQEKACYAIFEVDPPQDFIDCFLSPGESVDIWYAFVECDATSCCSVTYFPNGNGTVNYTLNTSSACTPGATPSLPPYLTWECKGQQFIIPVDQNQPIDCEDTCPTGSGTVFKQANEEIMESQNRFTLYPNPSESDLTLAYTIDEIDEFEVIVINTLGQEVARHLIQNQNGESTFTFTTDEWNAGIYTVRIQHDNKLLDAQRIQVIR